MGKYAETTTVSTESSRSEIERTLRRYNATSFVYGMDGARALVGFEIRGRRIRFILTMPDPQAKEFLFHSRGRRTPEAARNQWELACRQAWRALALVIKAKLEAVAAGITTIEDEFLAHTVLPDGSTVGDRVKPQIAESYRLGSMPPLLGLGYEGGP